MTSCWINSYKRDIVARAFSWSLGRFLGGGIRENSRLYPHLMSSSPAPTRRQPSLLCHLFWRPEEHATSATVFICLGAVAHFSEERPYCLLSSTVSSSGPISKCPGKKQKIKIKKIPSLTPSPLTKSWASKKAAKELANILIDSIGASRLGKDSMKFFSRSSHMPL